jgi:RNA recognition motif. (a.k.a. RRM, RBD, or RNP domain)
MKRIHKEDSTYLHETSASSVSVFVGGLGSRCKQKQLTQFMSQFGYVKEVYISKVKQSNGHNGFAFVNFYSVSLPNELFGLHQLRGSYIEVKRSLQGYLELQHLPINATERDISAMFKEEGYKVVRVLLGGKVAGIAKGSAAVKLLKHHDHEEAIQTKTFRLFNKAVTVVLHISKGPSKKLEHFIKKPTPRTGKNYNSESQALSTADSGESDKHPDVLESGLADELLFKDAKMEGELSSFSIDRDCSRIKKPLINSQKGVSYEEIQYCQSFVPSYQESAGCKFRQQRMVPDIQSSSPRVTFRENIMFGLSSPNLCSERPDHLLQCSGSRTWTEDYFVDVESDSTPKQELNFKFFAFPGVL